MLPIQIITVSGNLGKTNPERKQIGGNDAVVWTMAADNRDSKGMKLPNPTWYSCTMYGRFGDQILKYLKAGESCVVWGELNVSKGHSQTFHNVDVKYCRFVGGGGEDLAIEADGTGRQFPDRAQELFNDEA
tara:strand:- start:347 stop:739 length:393 start_codon:yes stop_codon:yes gene_type:complete